MFVYHSTQPVCAKAQTPFCSKLGKAGAGRLRPALYLAPKELSKGAKTSRLADLLPGSLLVRYCHRPQRTTKFNGVYTFYAQSFDCTKESEEV